jgi:hypothetical protein
MSEKTLTQSPKSPPSAIPAAALAASYIYYLLTTHIRNSKAPICVMPQIFVSTDAVSPPKASHMRDDAIYITIAGNGAYLNKQKRRLQRYVVTAWTKTNTPHYAEIGGRIITKGLNRKTRVIEESAPTLDPANGLYYVTVTGFMNTLLSGAELIY